MSKQDQCRVEAVSHEGPCASAPQDSIWIFFSGVGSECAASPILPFSAKPPLSANSFVLHFLLMFWMLVSTGIEKMFSMRGKLLASVVKLSLSVFYSFGPLPRHN